MDMYLGMQIANTPKQFQLLEEFAANSQQWGHNVSLLNTEETLEINPILSHQKISGSLIFHDDGLVSSRRLFQTFHPYLQEQGIHVCMYVCMYVLYCTVFHLFLCSIFSFKRCEACKRVYL